MSYSEKIQRQRIWNLIGAAVMQLGLVCVFLHFTLHFSFFSFTALKMHVCPAPTHRSYCLFCLHTASEQHHTSRHANRWQDGKQRQRCSGERNSQKSTVSCLARQADKNGSWREEVWRSWFICLSLLIVFTETQHMQHTCTHWHLFLHQLKWVQTCRQMERKGSVCRLLWLCLGCCLCVHWSAEEGACASRSDSAVFVPGVAWPAFMPSPVTWLAS